MERTQTTDPPRVEAILLDALGTLVGIEPPWATLIELLAARHGAVVGEKDVMRALRAEMTYYRAHCLEAADAASLETLRDGCAEVIARELGGPVAAIARRELSRTLVDSLRFAAYPEAAEVLRRLRAGGARLVVVSNWDVSLHDALEQAGLAGLVDGVVCSAVVGVAKPDPAVFRAGLALAGVPGERAVHVGDSYEEDVLGARAAGIEAVHLIRPPGRGGLLAPGAGGPGPGGGTRTISGLAELLDP